jgi:hypothetical protein
VAYARRLAQSALNATENATREMSGKLSEEASTPLAQLPARDTLTLSKRDAGTSSDEARLAVEREIQDKTEQLAALQKNLDTLRSLSAIKPVDDKEQAPASAESPAALQPKPPSLPLALAQAQPSSLLEKISGSTAIWAWVLALLASMVAWVWLVRRRPSKGDDLFAQHDANATARETKVSFMKDQSQEIQLERSPLPSGLPPQFANLDLNLTPAPERRPAAEANPPTGPKT